MSDHVAVHSAEDMCRLLQAACPDRAADFARAQHEKACWDDAQDRATFWQDVMALLSEWPERQPLPAEAA